MGLKFKEIRSITVRNNGRLSILQTAKFNFSKGLIFIRNIDIHTYIHTYKISKDIYTYIYIYIHIYVYTYININIFNKNNS